MQASEGTTTIVGPNAAPHGGGARASTWELPEEEEIFLKGSTRSWPDLSPLSPHPHDRLQFNGTQAWDSAPHKLAKTSALKNQLRAHGLNIGFELAATKKNALVPEFWGPAQSFKALLWQSVLSQKDPHDWLFLAWPGDSEQMRAKVRNTERNWC